ncbi:MAG: PTS sugar transporter subunit IIA [Anaerolineaceae bacterium]|nr:PTS sugar transporter subunit IIA [Anaerolineaceae bacterium]
MSNRILQLLEPSAVKLNVEAEDARDVLKQLGTALFEAGYVHASFVDAALEREKTMPTGLPLGGDYNAAIPHTEVEHVIKQGLALATLKNPVIFKNMIDPTSNVAVNIVFFMALDQPKAQIEMLQEIAGVLQNAKMIEQFIAAKNYNDVRKTLLASE